MTDPVVFKNGLAQWTTATGSTGYTQIPGVKSVEIPLSKAELANGVMSDNGEVFYPGIISAPITVMSRQEFTTGGIDDEVWTRWNSETKFKFRAAPVNTTLAATNPAYSFSAVFVSSYTPLSGAHGELLENSFQMRMLSGCAVTRVTSS